MKKLTLFFFTSILTVSALAQMHTSVAKDKKVPVISIEMFQPHWAWTWSYYTKKGEFYSSERYEVIAVNGTEVTLEMASRYHEHIPLSAHHRLYVDIQKCLNAYAKPHTKKPWLFRMEYWTGQAWEVAREAPTNAAFEEKFNCNSYVTTGMFETLFTTGDPEVGSTPVFQQRWSKQDYRPWYFFDGPFAAVAAQRFAGAAESEYAYTMHFQGYAEVTTPTPKFSKQFR